MSPRSDFKRLINIMIKNIIPIIGEVQEADALCMIDSSINWATFLDSYFAITIKIQNHLNLSIPQLGI